MTKTRYRAFPVVNTRGKYIGTVSRRNFMSIKKKQLILVDHNERSQAVDNIEEAEILEILDHHRIGSLETFQPIMFRNQPVGCTATIMYEIYAENIWRSRKYRRTSVCGDSVRYVDVPLTDLYGT